MSLRRTIVLSLMLAFWFLLNALNVSTALAAVITVNSLGDTTGACATSGTGTCTLRDAMTFANSAPGEDSINFEIDGTIELGAALPTVKNTLTMGATNVSITIDAGQVGSKILRVGKGATLNLTGGLTLTNGQCANSDTDMGAAIINRGTLNVTNVKFDSNTNCKAGGAIANYGEASVTQSTFTNNSAVFGGAISNESGTLNVTQSTFTNNTATLPFGSLGPAYGGAIWNDNDATLKVRGGTFTSNEAVKGWGGAIANIGQANVANSTLSQNSADTGGGIANGLDIDTRGTFTVKGSTLSGGSAGTGAGIANTGGTLNVQSSTLSGNQTSESGWGGGVYSGGSGTASITNSTLENGYAKYGGGVYTDSGTVNVLASTMSGNTGWAGGGAVYTLNSSLMMTNSTITNNTAAPFGAGGGFYNDSGGVVNVTNSTIYGNFDRGGSLGTEITSQGTSFTLRNSIISNDTDSKWDCNDITQTLAADKYNFASDDSCGQATVKPVAQLVVGTLAKNGGPTETMALGVNSAALGGGSPTICNAPVGAPTYGAGSVDQRGVARPQGMDCDAGAYQYNGQRGPSFVVNDNADTDDGLCAPWVPGVSNCTLREAVNAANSLKGGDVITFDIAAGLSGCAAANECTIALTAALATLETNLTIDGTQNNALITIDAGGNYELLTVDYNKTVKLNGLLLANGKCPGYDGGIVNRGTLYVTDSALVGNGTSNSGITNFGVLYVDTSVFSGNAACGGYAGGIVNHYKALVTDSTFSGNSDVTSLGGGIYTNGDLTVVGSTLSENYAAQGGGLYSYGGSVVVANSTLTQNHAAAGGAMYMNEGQLTVTNATIVRNEAPSGGGVANPQGLAEFYNSIIALNIGGDCSSQGVLLATKNSLDSDGSCGNATIASLAQLNLSSLQINGGPTETIKPELGSVARDTGQNSVCAAAVGAPNFGAGGIDQRGVKRPQGPKCDVGAFEVRVNQNN